MKTFNKMALFKSLDDFMQNAPNDIIELIVKKLNLDTRIMLSKAHKRPYINELDIQQYLHINEIAKHKLSRPVGQTIIYYHVKTISMIGNKLTDIVIHEYCINSKITAYFTKFTYDLSNEITEMLEHSYQMP